MTHDDRVNEYECTTDQKLADAAPYTLGRLCVCTHQMAALCVKWWRRGRHLRTYDALSKSDSVNRCVSTWRTI